MNREIKFRFLKPDNTFIYLTLSELIGWMPEFKPDKRDEWTGLKDKNGVEIYEGDIMRHNNGEVLTVKWLEYEGRFCAGKWYCLQNTMSKCEVIGNIHQNPELLK